MKKFLVVALSALMLVSVAACSSSGSEEDITLEGSAQGYGGEVTVTVVKNGDDIVSVEAVGENETEGVGSKAIEQLPKKIEEADSPDVDVISGATITSNAIIEAAKDALSKE
ncbi:FMN-binding protein [Garciella nitratireducens]|uniref:FMN-binding domain-containing protein n=1 Tax=Garciella nitratireducens DSM 15102 TaxID=1121911 RepID=A0A1T4NX32_9FIRM|nr:FMN-binding protein [Garciella nitratireducens]RBP46924.1 FMN-binding protein [Garciella nitratireducens]SJZ83617.1 FMN-binding domain-containing protein [Garciella nitratireducens DSM 15102]